MNSLRSRLASGRPLHGVWRIVAAPAITEIVAETGFDFQIFDREHGSFDYADTETHVRIAQLAGTAPLVRVSGLNRVEVQRCLDFGAEGIVFPQVNGRADVEEAARMVTYPPGGLRGFNPFTRSGRYGAGARTIDCPLCIPIIETMTAVDELDSILDLPSIELVYIGAYDLSVQLGRPAQMDHPPLLEIIQKICRQANVHGKTAALMVNNAAQVEAFTAWGARAFVHSVDANVIREAFANSRGSATTQLR